MKQSTAFYLGTGLSFIAGLASGLPFLPALLLGLSGGCISLLCCDINYAPAHRIFIPRNSWFTPTFNYNSDWYSSYQYHTRIPVRAHTQHPMTSTRTYTPQRQQTHIHDTPARARELPGNTQHRPMQQRPVILDTNRVNPHSLRIRPSPTN